MDVLIWTLYATLTGMVIISVSAILMLVGVKCFKPKSVHVPWADLPIVLALLAAMGAAIGGGIGYEIASAPARHGGWVVADLFIIMALMWGSQWALRKAWPEPDHRCKFALAAVWNVLAWVPAGIYYHWLRYLLG